MNSVEIHGSAKGCGPGRDHLFEGGTRDHPAFAELDTLAGAPREANASPLSAIPAPRVPPHRTAEAEYLECLPYGYSSAQTGAFTIWRKGPPLLSVSGGAGWDECYQ